MVSKVSKKSAWQHSGKAFKRNNRPGGQRQVCKSHRKRNHARSLRLLLEVDPQYGIHRFVKYVKGLSSRLLRLEFPELKSRLPTLWTNSYFVSTVGGAPLAIIKQYIENQKNV